MLQNETYPQNPVMLIDFHGRHNELNVKTGEGKMAKAKKSELSLVDPGSMTPNEARLTPEEIRRLLAITVDLLALCARASGRMIPRLAR